MLYTAVFFLDFKPHDRMQRDLHVTLNSFMDIGPVSSDISTAVFREVTLFLPDKLVLFLKFNSSTGLLAVETRCRGLC